jgi:hypothetical protein
VAAKTTAKTQLEQLQAEFEPGEHRSRSQGGQELTYVDISATLNRLNAALGTGWSIERASTKVELLESGSFFAFTELYLDADIDGTRKTAYGVGAMTNKDPDMAAKTALAEAIKKAGHQLGVALYLWDGDKRNRVNKAMKLANANDTVLKQEVFKLGRERTGKDKPTAADIAKAFGVKPGDLTDRETLEKILRDEGLL